MPLTLVQASTIVDKALEKGRELGLKPLTVAVLDAGGHLTALKREDGSSLLRPEIASGKAWGALGMGFGGRVPGRTILGAASGSHPPPYHTIARGSPGAPPETLPSSKRWASPRVGALSRCPAAC
jgi:uncharacterized protein GlcG (DUF336 family)